MDSGFIDDFITICEGKFPRDEIVTMHEGLSKPLFTPRYSETPRTQRSLQE